MKFMDMNSILIVDDSEADRYYIERVVEESNSTCKIFNAEDGERALDFLFDFDARKEQYEDDFPPTVIFLDINMPRMDGFEFLDAFSKLKEQDSRYNSIVIMMYTSSDNKEDMEKAKQYSCVRDYIIKPISESDIERIKNDVLVVK